MRKVLLAAAAFCFFGFTACKPSKDEMKKKFMESCEKSGASAMTNDASKKAFHEYCECSADKVIAKFSNDEIAAFDKMGQDEIQQKLMPVIQPCLDELQQKTMQQQMPAGAETTPADTTGGAMSY